MTTTESMNSFDRISGAGSEKTAWVAATTTPSAPAFLSASAALTMVRPVSIRSSTSRQTRPATSPTISCTETSFVTRGSRRLWMIASGAPSFSLQMSATFTRPMSGDTTVSVGGSSFARKCSSSTGIANRWSTGPSKKPWICGACRSTLMMRWAPAALNRSATRRAEIGSRPRPFLSWRAYG